jgi:hypothetical protein
MMLQLLPLLLLMLLPLCSYGFSPGMFSDPDFAVRSQVVDKRGRLLGEGGRTRKADAAIKR